jgi:FixJ family two-component response regulator
VNNKKNVIAVVDDDPRLIESLEDLFQSAGYTVRTFSSGRALIDAGLSDVNCLITDIGLPVLDGFELHEIVKRVRPDLPVFLITGRDVMGDEQRALINGIRGFFRKPFDGPAMLAAVFNALDDQ